MTTDQVLTLIISGMAVLFAMMVAILGLLWRAGDHWGSLLTEVKHLGESIGQLAIDTNKRLQYLERGRGRGRGRGR